MILALTDAVDDAVIDSYIEREYDRKRRDRESHIPSQEIVEELKKVTKFDWGVVQGNLDGKIQSQYVRKIWHYDDLLEAVKSRLHSEVTAYVTCTWYNHWSTVLIEDRISSHPRVIPTLKNVKGVDIFFCGQPFDLKITYLPKSFDWNDACKEPLLLAKWLYENQGAQRFGSDNRFFVIVYDPRSPETSWKLKRDVDLIAARVNHFFDVESVSEDDEVLFSFAHKTYSALSKVLLITP